jgi:hypothetical protein
LRANNLFASRDGGFVANNPTLYALADARLLGHLPENIRVVSVGVGEYPAPTLPAFTRLRAI